MLPIARALLARLDFDFAAAVAAHEAAVAAHASTVGQPAPTAHPLVEAAVHAGGYEVIEPEPAPAPAPEPPTAEDLRRAVEAARDRRLAVGFDYDFADARGVHRFGTTAADRRGWAEVKAISDAALAAGQPDLSIDVRTDSGAVTLRADEWPAIQLAAAQAFQPVWQASWTVKDAVAAGTVATLDAVESHPAWPPLP